MCSSSSLVLHQANNVVPPLAHSLFLSLLSYHSPSSEHTSTYWSNLSPFNNIRDSRPHRHQRESGLFITTFSISKKLQRKFRDLRGPTVKWFRLIFFDSKNWRGCFKTYTAMEVRLLRKRSWTLAGRPAGRPSSRHVSTRMSGMACGTQSDFERSRFGGQKPTAEGLSVLLVVVCDRFRSRNKIDDNFILWVFRLFDSKCDHLSGWQSRPEGTHTHTHAHN